MKHEFSESAPSVVVPIVAPFGIVFTLTPPLGWRPTPGVATSLLGIRTHKGKPRDVEVAQLKVSGGGQLVVELSGYGNKQPQFREPLKMPLPSDGRYTVAYSEGQVAVNGVAGETHLKSSGVLELEFGFENVHSKSLVPPFGWVLEADVIAQPRPPAPPPPVVTPPTPEPPPVTVPPVVTPPVTPPPPATGGSATDALVADLEAVLLKHAPALLGLDATTVALLQLAITLLGKK